MENARAPGNRFGPAGIRGEIGGDHLEGIGILPSLGHQCPDLVGLGQ